MGQEVKDIKACEITNITEAELNDAVQIYSRISGFDVNYQAGSNNKFYVHTNSETVPDRLVNILLLSGRPVREVLLRK